MDEERTQRIESGSHRPERGIDHRIAEQCALGFERGHARFELMLL